VHVRTFAALEVIFPRFVVPIAKRREPLQRVPLGSQVVDRPRDRIVRVGVAK